MSITPRKLGPVTPDEALALLADVPLGRIVFTERAMPAIRPATHLVDNGVIIARSHDGSEVVPVRSGRETVVAYQADDIDVGSRLGWTIVATGPATQVRDPDEISRYAAVLPRWAEGAGEQLIRIDPGIVNGYRLIEPEA